MRQIWKRKKQSTNDINNFNNKHIIQCYNKTISNVPEERRYIPSMTPTGFINGQYESRCYVNSSFQLLYFNVFFRQLIMNIDCEKIIESLDNSKDYYRGYIQKIMILQVIQQNFCEMLIDGRKIVNGDVFFKATNIRKNVQNDSSEFEGLIHKMVPKKPFMIQVIC